MRQKSLWVKLLLCFTMLFCAFGAVFSVADREVKTVSAATVDMKDTLTLEDWGTASGEDNTFIAVKNNGSHIFASEVLQGYWNDHPQKASSNGGCDIMEYIHINGESARTLITRNATDRTYTGTTFPFQHGGVYSPVVVETVGSGSGLYVKVLSDFAPHGTFEIAFKAGFSLLDSSGNTLTLSEDVTYHFVDGIFTKAVPAVEYTLSFESTEGTVDPMTVCGGQPIGTLPAVPEKTGYVGVWMIDGVAIKESTVYTYGADKTAVAVYSQNIDITDTVSIEDWGNVGGDDHSYLVVKNNGDYMFADTDLRKYWNDHLELADGNDGCDIMEYIHINGVSARALVNQNATDRVYVGTTAPFSYNGVFAPILVETTGDNGAGICIKVLSDYAAPGTFSVTLKAGFTLKNTNGNRWVISEDVTYHTTDSGFMKYESYEISFEGTEETLDPITVCKGNKMSNLPALPEKAGYEGVWLIDGIVVSTESIFNYSENKTAVAVYTTEIDITDTVSIEDWGNVGGDDHSYLVVKNDGEYMFASTNLRAYWNDHLELANGNNGCDIMEYIHINGVSARDLINQNAADRVYEGANPPFSYGGLFAPILVETVGEAGAGICIKILSDYAAPGTFSVTLKAGFTLINADGNRWTISEDVTYHTTDSGFMKYESYEISFEGTEETLDPITVCKGNKMSNLPALPEIAGYEGVWLIDGTVVTAESTFNYSENKTAVASYVQVVDMKDTLTMEDWTEIVGEDGSICIVVKHAGDYIVVSEGMKGYWNDHLERANFNAGCDIMEYVYINGISARALINQNATDRVYEGTTEPFSYGGLFAPVLVETTGEGNKGFNVRVMTEYVSKEELKITLKAGLILMCGDVKLILSEDVTYHFATAGFVEYVEYTLSFDGAEATPMTVCANDAIGALPAIPERAGYTGAWTIDGVAIAEDSIYAYGENKTATLQYALTEYTITIVRANGSQETLYFTIENKAAILATVALTENNRRYTYAWQEALPTELALQNYTFTETRTQLPPTTDMTSYSVTVGQSFALNVYVTVLDTAVPQIRFVMGEKTATVEGIAVDATQGKYVYTFSGIYAHELADEITASLYIDGKEVDCLTFSVEGYLIALSNTKIDASLQTVIADTIALAQAAEANVGKTDGVQSIVGLTATAYTDLTTTDYQETVSANNGIAMTVVYADSVDGNQLVFRFRADSTDGLKVTINGNAVDYTLVEEGNVYYEARVTVHYAACDAKYQCVLSVNDTAVQTTVFSVKSYAYDMQNRTDAAVDYAKALYTYGLTLNAYSKGE